MFYIDCSFTALSKIILTKLSGSLTSLLLLLLLPPLLLLVVADWLLVSPSLFSLVAATFEFDVRVMVGVLVLVKVTGTFTSGEPSCDTVSDHLVSSQPRPAPRPKTVGMRGVRRGPVSSCRVITWGPPGAAAGPVNTFS